MRSKVNRFIFSLTILKLVFVLIAILAPFSHPHIIRQMDTLGIVIRYFLRWTIEEPSQNLLLPALIQAGDHIGIHAVEFPILYIFMAPLQAIPAPYNVFITRIVFLLFSLALTYFSYKKWSDQKELKFDAKRVHLLFLLLGVSNIFFSRFMPDYVAFILVSIAMGEALSKKKYSHIVAFVFCSFGLLLKPPAVLTMGILFLLRFKDFGNHLLKWIIPSLIVTLIYYTLGTGYLNSISDIPTYFYSRFRNPITQLYQFFLHPKQIVSLIFKDIFSSFSILFLVYDFVKNKKWQNKYIVFLWGILLLQILGGAFLDGKHTFIHYYYFISTSFTAALLFSEFLKTNEFKKMTCFFFLFLFVYICDKGVYSIRKSFDSNNQWWQCAEIKKILPNDIDRIRTIEFRGADIGTCVGLKQNSKTAKYGIFSRKDKVENVFEVIHKTKDYQVVRFK